MAKQTLNLTIKESIKERAKRIAKNKGISVSRLFEEAIIREEDPEELHFDPESAAYKIYHMIPESEKVEVYDYKEMKENILKEKYGL